MKRYTFNSDNDVKDFIEDLINSNLTFHLDDDPEDCLTGVASDSDIYCIKLNMIDLWKFCDPWQVLERFPKTLNQYMNK